jgi:hypothetical protein
MITLRRREDGSYTVYGGDELIGTVWRQNDGRWKAVNGYRNWSAYYKTRGNAVAGLARRHKVQP